MFLHEVKRFHFVSLEKTKRFKWKFKFSVTHSPSKFINTHNTSLKLVPCLICEKYTSAIKFEIIWRIYSKTVLTYIRKNGDVVFASLFLVAARTTCILLTSFHGVGVLTTEIHGHENGMWLLIDLSSNRKWRPIRESQYSKASVSSNPLFECFWTLTLRGYTRFKSRSYVKILHRQGKLVDPFIAKISARFKILNY